jgi:hypothetical protein
MIIVSVVRGVRDHLHIRATEWLMVYPAVFFGIVLLYQDDLFQNSASFAQVAAWADQSTWALCVLLCALTRLVALTVNGTFKNFTYSPHMRLTASFCGIAFWSQYCLGLLSTALLDNGAWSGPVIYSTLCLAELLNLYRSWTDIARGRH